MELKKILIGLENLKVRGELSTEITNITSDSREVKKGTLFVAIKGFEADGHTYIKDVIEKGATAIMFQDTTELKKIKVPDDIVLIQAKETRYANAICDCNFYGNPSRKMKLVGITGTKGKTTTSYMIKSILEKEGKKVGLIGSIATYIGDKKLEDSDRTTPNSDKLQKIFAQMADEGVEIVVMEVSSQSIKLNRVAGCEFEIGVFTNLSEDHISPKEHADMDEYFNTKLKLFEHCKLGFTNADDIMCAKIKKILPEFNLKTYGIDNYCDFTARDLTITNSYVDFKLKLYNQNERIKIPIPGRFSVYNALAAIDVCLRLGATTKSIKEALLEIKVPGRSEMVENELGLSIMLDHAHTPDSLKNILSAVKTYTKGKVIAVFGCGGDRDSAKRPMMGEIGGKIADFSIITTDNPRTEEPERILKQIEEGMKKTNGKYICILDRKKAIEYAMKMAQKDDLIVLAGKGDEKYQEINKVKYPFDERKIVKAVAEELHKENKVKKDRSKKR